MDGMDESNLHISIISSMIGHFKSEKVNKQALFCNDTQLTIILIVWKKM